MSSLFPACGRLLLILHDVPAISVMITLLTDFGTSDYFVGAMKGAILTVNPRARIFDLTHEIPPQEIRAGAFNLLAAYKTFPAGTIHVAVVDPGVGSTRRPVVVTAGGYFFVGPDNGLFSYIYEREADPRVFHLTSRQYFRHPVSQTFHGRDIFAPVAGALSNGVQPSELGPEIEDYVRLEPLLPTAIADERLAGTLIHVDHFGNCITNLTRQEADASMFERGARLIIAGQEINSFRTFYASAEAAAGELFAIYGSAGFLEIAAFKDSAARRLNVKAGEPFVFVKSGPA